MNFNISDILRGALTLAVLLLVACGDGGGSAPAPTSTHLMGGAVQGNPLNLTPTVSTFAGTTSTKVDGTGTQARFNSPYGITSDGINLYVSDTLNNAIRKIVIATGVVTTMAGSGTAGAADGIGSAATFDQPYGITTDGTNLYVADTNNNKIRQIVIATGEVSSLTGAANTVSGGAQRMARGRRPRSTYLLASPSTVATCMWRMH
jgi:DNA-binding beta-propeller fold protein YncE